MTDKNTDNSENETIAKAKIEKVEMDNFKSFKKATIPLSEGFTTIVGPNGSGKSNIIDAVAFAIGTNKMSNLRANVLTDLVKKDSNKDTAKVKLILRDYGGEKHEVQREITEEGSSVFRINGTRTTNQKITDLLSAMNIMPDGHNIIMQGDITEFIQKTPQERRKIIEEVSGIAEYEKKKDKSLNKLEDVAEKITEAEIIHSERKGRVEALKEEKNEAQKYQDLKEDEKKHRATILKKKLEKTKKKYEKTLKKISESKQEVEKLEKNKEELKQEKKEKQSKIDSLEEEIMEKSEAKQEGIREEIQELKNKLSVLEEKITQKRKTKKDNKEQINELNKKVSEIGNKIDEKQEKLEEVELKEQEKIKELNEKQEKLNKLKKESGDLRSRIETIQEEIEQLNEEIDGLKDEAREKKSKIDTATEKIKMKQKNKEELQTKKEYKEKHGKIKETLENKEKQKEKIQKELKKKQEETENIQKEIEDKKKQLENEEENYEDKKKELNELKSKINVIEEIKGENKAVKKIKENKNQELNGIIGTVSDVINHKSKYSSAVEKNMEEQLSYILTETKEDALKAIDYLKEKQLGKATFIPLDDLPEKKLKENELKGEKTIDYLRNLIDTDRKYEKAINQLLGNKILVEDLSLVKTQGKDEYVTIEGEELTKEGFITGGYEKETITKKDIDKAENLEEETKKIQNRLKELQKEIKNKEKQLENEKENKSDLRINLKGINATIRTLKERLEEYESMKTKAETKEEDLQEEIDELKEEKEQLEEEKELIEEKLSKKLEKRRKKKEKLKEPKIKETREELNNLRRKINEIKEEKSKAITKKEKIASELEKALKGKQEDLKERRKEMEEINQEIEEEIEELKGERNGLTLTLKEKESKAREKAGSLEQLFKSKEKIQEKKREIEEEIEDKNNEINKLKDTINRSEIKQAQLEAKKNSINSEYGRFKNAEKIEDKSKRKLKEELEEIEKELEKIGEVNLKAIEQYKKEKEELKEIKEKKKKLEEEKQSIEQMIGELEQKKKKTFIKTFDAINEKFSEKFKSFYPEKEAEAFLELEDKNDPLESGLLIEAKPAGKEVKNIDAMSGGEKTITALSFIFAIQSHKPSPFYILDEIGATLDDENSERVAKMLKESSERIQYIAVTHNPPITRESDQIIGVHMNEDKNSSLIEVNLKDYSQYTEE